MKLYAAARGAFRDAAETVALASAPVLPQELFLAANSVPGCSDIKWFAADPCCARQQSLKPGANLRQVARCVETGPAVAPAASRANAAKCVNVRLSTRGVEIWIFIGQWATFSV